MSIIDDMAMYDMFEKIMEKYDIKALILSNESALPMHEVFIDKDREGEPSLVPMMTTVQTFINSASAKLNMSSMKSAIIKTDSRKKCMIKVLTDRKSNTFLCGLMTDNELIIAERLDAAMKEIEDKIIDLVSK